MRIISAFIGLVFQIASAMLAYQINIAANSSCLLVWSIIDFFPPFTFFAWIKWFIYHQVNMTIIKHTFSWFFN